MYIKGRIGWALWIWSESYRCSLLISTPFLTAIPWYLEQCGSSRPEKDLPMCLSHFALEQTLQSSLSYTPYHIFEAAYLRMLPKSKLRNRGVEWFVLGYPWSRGGSPEGWIPSLQSYYMSVLIFTLTLGLLKVCNSTHFNYIFFAFLLC